MVYPDVQKRGVHTKKRNFESLKDYMAYLYYLYHSPKLAISLLTKVTLAAVTSPVLYYFEKYVFNEWEIGAALFIIVAFDIIWVIAKNLRSRIKFSWLDIILSGCIAMAVLTFLCILHLYTNFVTKPDYPVVIWAKSFIYAGIFTVYLAKISQNMYLATNNYFPPEWMMRRINNFKNSGNIEDLKGKNDGNTSSGQ